MAGRTKKLTSVSYGILGLLGLRPHTPYELAQQFRRSGTFWATAESVVYNEPETLVAHGLAGAAAPAIRSPRPGVRSCAAGCPTPPPNHSPRLPHASGRGYDGPSE